MKTVLILSLVLIFSCKTKEKVSSTNSSFPSPPVYIYKTKHDYYNNVPVKLSQDKKEILSYPAPSDLLVGGKLSLPTKLANGYLLDNRGISQKTAFLSYKYNEYSQLMVLPNMEEMKKKIIDNDPFVELYYCGNKSDFQDIAKELNKIIKSKDFKKLKKIK